MTRTENQFSRINSTCWFGTRLHERAPQASQYPSSSFPIVRHSQHSFDISRIMPEAGVVSHSQQWEKSWYPGGYWSIALGQEARHTSRKR